MLWTVIGGFVLIAMIDLMPLIRLRKWRAVAAFACVFAAALTLGVLTALNIEIPSIMYPLRDFVKWLGLGYSP